MMSTYSRRLTCIMLLALCLGTPHPSSAQLKNLNIKYDSGQNVQPIFDGWSKNPDGTYSMHFGYLNRNYIEEIHVPIGPANSFEPGGVDRGQPTYFYTRFRHGTFSVTVPKDWGKKELVWTLTAHGRTDKAVAWLQPEWEIEPGGGGRKEGDAAKNLPPTLALDVTQPLVVPTSTTLSINSAVTDDGLPPLRKPQRGGNSENPPSFRRPAGSPDAPVNLPQLERRAGGQGAASRARLTVSWIVWRGPAGVVFDPPVFAVTDGKANVKATFTKPGDYVLRARASDTQLFAQQDVNVTVK